jgi:hypothetical protein
VVRESTKGNFAVNRTMIRGVTAGLIGTTLLGAAAIIGPEIANGAEGNPSFTKPLPAAQQQAAMRWDLPNARYLKHVHPVRHHRHRHHAASRSSYRTALTGSPQTVAHALLLRQGWSESQWTCLNALWTRESGWNTYATNHSSGAYGIPQALPATKMATAGSDWRTNPITQIRWGLSYIAQAYGSPCNALSHSNSYGYY